MIATLNKLLKILEREKQNFKDLKNEIISINSASLENLNIDKNYYISIEKILKLIIHDIENIKDSYDQTSFDKKLAEFQDLVKINNTQLENKWVSYINNEITKFDNLYQILEIINDSEKKSLKAL